MLGVELRGKRGQTIFSNVLIGLIVLFVIAIGITAAVNWSGPSSISDSFDKVSKVILDIGGPLFSFLLNLSGKDTNIAFLIVLTFIMVSVIIIGTLDSINIFGENKNGKLINFVVGIIVSLIGIRFMPDNMWSSLTAPSSAFVATLLVGLPFAALAFVSMKVKFNLARKMIWLFYLIFMTYLIFSVGSDAFKWIYVVFVVLALVMMFFDASVRKYIYKEKAKMDVQKVISNMSALEKQKIRQKIKEWQAIVNDTEASKGDQALADVNLKLLVKKYGDLSQI